MDDEIILTVSIAQDYYIIYTNKNIAVSQRSIVLIRYRIKFNFVFK